MGNGYLFASICVRIHSDSCGPLFCLRLLATNLRGERGHRCRAEFRWPWVWTEWPTGTAIERQVYYCFRDRIQKGFFLGVQVKRANCSLKWAVWADGCSTGPNYHPGGKPEWDACAELYPCRELCTLSLLERDSQGQSSVFRDMLLNKTGREREAPVKKRVPTFGAKLWTPPTPGGLLPYSKVLRKALRFGSKDI